MSTRKIIDPKQNGEKVWLKSHAQATYMSDGTTVEDAIKNISVPPAIDTTEYATKEELRGKQDLIDDLETIRSGAAKGATALQPGDIPNSAEPMVCAYRITSYTANHIELDNYTYNGQTMDYREGAIISILNPNSADVVFEGGIITLDGNDYESNAFTLKGGATALFTLGVDSGILFPVSSVVESNSGGSSEAYAGNYPRVYEVISEGQVILQPNTYYTLEIMGNIEIALAEPTNTDIVNEYVFVLINNIHLGGTSIALPEDVYWVNGTPIIGTNEVLEVSIIDYIALWIKY